MRKIRILLVSDEMEAGGSQRQIVALAKALDTQRFDVTVAYFRNKSFLVEELLAAQIGVVQIAKRWRIDFLFFSRFYRFLRSGRFDIVHAFSFSAETWSAAALTFYRWPVLVTSIRGVYEWYGPLQWIIKRWVTGRSAVVISNSKAGRNYAVERMGKFTGRINVIANGLAAPMIQKPALKTRQDLDISDTTPLLLFVGRLVEDKNIPCLLRAVALVREKSPEVLLLLAGSGEQRTELDKFVCRNRLSSNVRFLGERSDAVDLMAAADIVVLPSFREGLSNVLLEAMQLGKPVIASSVGGTPELIRHRETGLLFKSDNEVELARHLSELLGNQPLAASLGERARSLVETEFSISKMVNAFSDIYQESLSASRSHKYFAVGQSQGQEKLR